MMIRAISWCGSTHAGCVVREDWAHLRPLPEMELPVLVDSLGGTVKYLNQLNTEAVTCLRSACLAMEASGLHLRRGDQPGEPRDIGVLVTGYTGWLDAEYRYFDDYVRYGRLTGGGSLFVCTLPTTVAAQVSLTLRLAGPVLHFASETNPAAELLRQGQSLVELGEAEGMLLLNSDGQSCICWLIDGSQSVDTRPPPEYLTGELSPTELVARLSEATQTRAK